MKSPFLFLLLPFIACRASAQEQLSKDLQSLVNTEHAFAEMARNKNTKDAFLQYLSDETVMFADGKISIGKKRWEERKPDSTLLIWMPVFADISASGDFGYTTGPSEYYASRKKGEQAFYGSYITMWKKENGSAWKMALDIGVYPQPKSSPASLTTPRIVKPSNITKTNYSQEVTEQEMLFVKKISGQEGIDYSAFIADQSRFLRPGKEPLTEKIKIEELIKKEKGNASYTPVDTRASSTGDMAFIYGKVKLNERAQLTDGYYLRIYKKDDRNNWKIVLDAIQQ